jgi:spore coat polysaccharide biosynthesis protein SpsF (cytidylyltransferase family)
VSETLKARALRKAPEKEKARTYEVTKRRREDAQRFIYEYLSYQKCADCGEYDFSVLTFDHVRGKKKKEISRMVADGDSIEAIKDELAKCEIVCFNCHMRREQKRRSGGRFRKFWPD